MEKKCGRELPRLWRFNPCFLVNILLNACFLWLKRGVGTVIGLGRQIKIMIMKKVFLVLAVATTFVACKNRQEKTAGVDSTTIQAAPAPVVVEKEVRYVQSPNTQNTTQVEQKKGMSKAAKGAIIGGVGGAVVGGVATKSTKGAVIGGVVGATGGYIIGRSKDKKDGRVQ